MENLNTQIMAVEKVLEEMQKAETNLNSWNAFWWEIYEDTVLPQAYFDSPHWENEKLSIEISKIDSTTYTSHYMGVPLRKIWLGEKYSCDISTIVWRGILTKHSTRRIRFSNNGNIEIEKSTNRKQTKKYPKKIGYSAQYNVLSADFMLSIIINKLIAESGHESDKITISLSGNIVTIKYNEVEIIKDINTGYRKVKLIETNKRKKASLIFEAMLNSNDNLEKAHIIINTHKGNGKVNGVYKFDVDSENCVQANFYSRKGVKYNLIGSTELKEKVSKLLLVVSQQYSKDSIILNFIDLVREKIVQNLIPVSIDSSHFIENLKELEKNIMNIVKNIKGEMPLFGLIERINNYCYYNQYGEKEETCKVLELVTQNK